MLCYIELCKRFSDTLFRGDTGQFGQAKLWHLMYTLFNTRFRMNGDQVGTMLDLRLLGKPTRQFGELGAVTGGHF